MFKLWIGLAIGNFIWKGIKMLLTGKDYELDEALKISFFQAVALLMASIIL